MIKNKICALVDLEMEDRIQLSSISNNEHNALLPVFGKYTLIDFVLSNLMNSGITNINLLLTKTDHALLNYIKNGKWWNLDKKSSGLVFMFSPISDVGTNYNIKTLYHNLEIIEKSKAEFVLISSINKIIELDIRSLITLMKPNDDGLLIYKTYQNEDIYLNAKVVNFDEHDMVQSFGINSGLMPDFHYDTGVFLLRLPFFVQLVKMAIMHSPEQKIQDYLRKNLNNCRLRAIVCKGFYAPVDSVEKYYKTNMEIMHDPDFHIAEKTQIQSPGRDFPPSFYSDAANSKGVIVGSGCYINGKVTNSIIFHNVQIARGCVIENCIIMDGCHIGNNTKLRNLIISKNVAIGKNKEIINDQKKPLVISYKSSL